MDAEELPRVTRGLLRAADTMCGRRLAHEFESSSKPTKLGGGTFAVSSRVIQDAVTGHRSPDVPLGQAFVETDELVPEQRAVYRAAAAGYVARFAGTRADVADLGWETTFPDLGVRLVGPVGIALEHHDGTRELREVLVAGRDRLLDEVDLHFMVLRAHAWTTGELYVQAIDLLAVQSEEYTIDVAQRLPSSLEWLAERVDTIRRRADRDRPAVGRDCGFCPCVPGCPPLTRAS